MLRTLFSLAVIVQLVACASSGIGDAPVVAPQALDRFDDPYYLEIRHDPEMAFVGQPKLDRELNGANGGPLYPGDTAATFLAALITHAVIADSVENSKQQALVDEANAILAPYASIIADVDPDAVLVYAAAHGSPDAERMIVPVTDEAGFRGWHTIVEPVYILSHSEDTLSVRANVQIYERRSQDDQPVGEPVYSRVVHLQSAVQDGAEAWMDDGGALFKHTVSALTSDVVSLAMKNFLEGLSATDKPTQTIRYLDNGEKTVERGKVITLDCQFVLFESLRNELKRMKPMQGCSAD